VAHERRSILVCRASLRRGRATTVARSPPPPLPPPPPPPASARRRCRAAPRAYVRALNSTRSLSFSTAPRLVWRGALAAWEYGRFFFSSFPFLSPLFFFLPFPPSLALPPSPSRAVSLFPPRARFRHAAAARAILFRVFFLSLFFFSSRRRPPPPSIPPRPRFANRGRLRIF